MEDYYTYETKCRRCSNIEQWVFSPKSSFVWTTFANTMSDYVNNPRLSPCKICDKSTVQDVVSYSDFND